MLSTASGDATTHTQVPASLLVVDHWEHPVQCNQCAETHIHTALNKLTPGAIARPCWESDDCRGNLIVQGDPEPVYRVPPISPW